MQTSEVIKRRLETAEDLRSVVRTMKALAAANIRQYEEAVSALRDYTRSVDLGLQTLLRQRPDIVAALSRQRAERPGLIVLGSDQGLCGAFNEQIAGFFLERLATDDDRPLLVIGTRLAGRLQDAGARIGDTRTLPASAALVTALVQDILALVDGWRDTGEVDSVRIYFNRPGGGGAYRPAEEVLLPLDPTRLRRLAAASWRPRAAPACKSDWDALFSAVVGAHLFVTVHTAIAESLVSENASRLAAMHAAERNIEDRLSELRGEFHRHRQTSITSELLEIVSGYEALSPR